MNYVEICPFFGVKIMCQPMSGLDSLRENTGFILE
jgi:hypothetical protein